MSKRAELYRVVRDLKEYVRWQRAEGAAGSVPAPDEARRAFEERAKALQQKKIDHLTSAPSTPDVDADAGAASSATEQAADAKEPAESSGPMPWKDFGSRPARRFGGGPAPQASTNDDDETAESETAENETPESETTDRGGRNYDDRSYPEAADPDAQSAPVADAQASSGGSNGGGGASKMSKRDKLDYLREYLGDCRRCGLCEHRSNIVFGTGSAEARLVFVGEAPGYNEDKQAEPFVGKAGKLLDKMIAAMGLEREEVYICNVIKCRPPDNRDPLADEIRECSPFLRKQLEIIEPEAIVTLGRFAGQFITGDDESMGALRGRWHDWEQIPVMPTYHPAYLLRSPDQKRKVWSDLQMVMERLDLSGTS